MAIEEMEDEMAERVEFPVYEILRTGYVGSEYRSFVVGSEGVSQVVGDGGWRQVGVVTAPAGSELHTTNANEVALFLPNESTGIDANSIVRGGYYAIGIGYRNLESE